MTADPLPSVSRVRKARRSGRVACGHHVQVGHIIVKRAGRWTCLECALAAIRAARNVPAGSLPAAAPTERKAP